MNLEQSEKKALINYRLARAHETLQDAQTLFKQNRTAASVVNRAYYSMFYAALALLASIDKESIKHKGVLSLFDQYFIKPNILPKEMSKFLHQAFDMRLTGDYEEDADLTREDASTVLQTAVDFIDTVEKKFKDEE